MTDIKITEVPNINMERIEAMRAAMKDETKVFLQRDIGELPTLDDLANLFVKYYALVRARAEAIVDAERTIGI